MADELNEDVWVNILKRLPVKTIYRFQSVCKSWKSLITSSFFKNLKNSNKPYILFRELGFPPSNTRYDYAFCSMQTINVEDQLKFVPCPFQLSHHTLKFQVTGVLHGIVCLSSIANSTTVLWNPSIHKYTMIPPSPYRTYSSCFESDISLGFGFDSLNHDFKLVRNIKLYGTYVTCDVFSFRQGLWRTVVSDDHIGPFSTTCIILSPKPTTLHNRFSHWIVKDYFISTSIILVFDCERDELKTMDLPPEFNNNGFIPWLSDTSYYGMLSVVGCRGLWDNGHGHSENEVVTWVMVEYGVATSWKKLTTVDGRDFVPGTPSKLHPYVFEPSMFLMDQNTKAESYNMSRDRYGKVCYIKDGTQCDYIQVPFT